MDYTNFTLALPANPIQFDPTSLYAALLTIPDHRKRRGVRYPLAPMLFIAIFAKLLGCQKPRAIAHFAQLHAAQLCDLLQLERSIMPHHTTWSRWFKDAIDDEELYEVCAPFLRQISAERRQQLAPDTPAQLTIDGKTLRGTIPAGQTQGDHLLSIYDPHTAVVIIQQQVDTKTNEIPVAQELLGQVELHGKIVTADAMHTQAKTARQIVAAGGDYLFTVKGNQWQLAQDISFLFTAESAAWQQGSTWVDFLSYSTMEKGHGRIEWRKLTCSTMLNQYAGFPELGQVFMVERVCWRSDGSLLRQETRYGVTSLSRAEAGPARLLELLRGHWLIENGLHWRRDLVLNEDGTRMKRNSGGAVLATLNNVVISLVGRRNLAAAISEYNARPTFALALLTSSP